MPIYVYRCDLCAHEFEALQKISADPLKNCPSCGKDGLKKQVTAAAFRLKGGGWYESDFKSTNQKNLASSDSSASGTSVSDTSASGTSTADKSSSVSDKKETSTKHSCGSGCSHVK